MDFGKGEEYAFSVDETVLVKFQLKKGLELDDFSLMEIHFQDDIRKAYNAAIIYLGRRLRSKKEVKDYLQNKNMEEPIINEVIHKLLNQKYLDDVEYTHSYLRTQVNTTDKGPELIGMELREKGIDKAIIETAMEEYPLELQLEKTKKLCEKYIQKNKTDAIKVMKLKLENLLKRKGYPFSVIHSTFGKIDFDKESDNELDAIRVQGEKMDRKFRHFDGKEYEQKMKQALYRKGFTIDLIEQYISELNEEKS